MFALKHKLRHSTSSQGSTDKEDGGKEQLFSRSRLVLQDNAAAIASKDALEITDIVDDDYNDDGDDSAFLQSQSNGSASNPSSVPRLSVASRVIDIETAKKLKVLLIGDATKPIGPEWVFQYFDFDARTPELWYGLVQHQGGPCGLLATLQGYLCAELFHYNRVDASEKEADLDNYRYRCLAQAIGSLLWQIGGHQQNVMLAFETNRAIFSRQQLPETADFVPDGITERIRLAEFTEQAKLVQFMSELFDQDRQSLGCISLAYSCILTRGIDKIRRDYDSGSIESLLTPERLLCTQELINLALIGRAVSNVFDRNFVLSSEMILQGINRQSIIGFLTIHEHEGAFKVGACYKNSKLPIYVVLSEYHFTLLFSKQKNGNWHEEEADPGSATSTKFDLFYYDGLLGQDHEIRLTIDTEPNRIQNGSQSQESIMGPSPIECVIRTKWPTASINWNGSSKLF